MDKSIKYAIVATSPVIAMSHVSSARLPNMFDQADTLRTSPSIDITDKKRLSGLNLKPNRIAVASRSLTELDNSQQMDSRTETTRVNDFSIDESDEYSPIISKNFDFGIYLEYWRHGRRNSVIPIYETLREELTQNRHATISEETYVQLVQTCESFLSVGFKANDIGRSNEICNIAPGTAITIEHLIALKIYTDFDRLQTEFKRHCRRLHIGESLESVMERNQEIAHWSRLLRESVMFWGKTMAKKEEFYCGLTARLVLRSLNQRFECPLSTTRSFGMIFSLNHIHIRLSFVHEYSSYVRCLQSTIGVAQRFTDNYRGVILRIKRANTRTRCFDVSSLSVYSEEEERLFIGSTIKIIDIVTFNDVDGKWESMKPNYFVAALSMFQQIYNGHFVDGNSETRALLLKLLQCLHQNDYQKTTKSM